MVPRRQVPPAGLSPHDADVLQRAIHALGDYAHVACERGVAT